MPLEIERKFLIKDDSYKTIAKSSHTISQGYLSRIPERIVRIRTLDSRGFITIKGITIGCVREEFEYEIPYDDALKLLGLCIPPIVKKIRFIVPYKGYNWEIDEFSSPENVTTVAEVELPHADAEIELPPFIGEEVTGNPAYYNSNIGLSPIP